MASGRLEPANELSLRVSVATLVRVLFDHPQNGAPMLALERKATLTDEPGGQRVYVRAQPFGGGIRLRDPAPLRNLIGDFQFDSERSRAEDDFRILIRAADWPAVRQFCLEHLAGADDPALDADPARELSEEFADALAVDLQPGQYQARPVGLVVADGPAPTHNPRAPGAATARIYRIFEARLLDPALAQALLASSARVSDEDLRQQALAEARAGGRGRANAALVLPLNDLAAAYLALRPEVRAAPLAFDGHLLDGNVPAVLDGVPVPEFEFR